MIGVAELIAQLQECPQDAVVVFQSADGGYTCGLACDDDLGVETWTLAMPGPTTVKRTFVTLRESDD